MIYIFTITFIISILERMRNKFASRRIKFKNCLKIACNGDTGWYRLKGQKINRNLNYHHHCCYVRFTENKQSKIELRFLVFCLTFRNTEKAKVRFFIFGLESEFGTKGIATESIETSTFVRWQLSAFL